MRTTTPLSIDTANRVINEQEDAIAELKHKLYDLEDQRDVARQGFTDLIKDMSRISSSESLEDAIAIAKKALGGKE